VYRCLSLAALSCVGQLRPDCLQRSFAQALWLILLSIAVRSRTYYHHHHHESLVVIDESLVMIDESLVMSDD
jgi:hypothetical protein